MIRIHSATGADEGWIRTDIIVGVGPNPGQRFVQWIDAGGARRESVAARGQDVVLMALVAEALA
jgi:hypothetical protein